MRPTFYRCLRRLAMPRIGGAPPPVPSITLKANATLASELASCAAWHPEGFNFLFPGRSRRQVVYQRDEPGVVAQSRQIRVALHVRRVLVACAYRVFQRVQRLLA